MMGFMYRTTSPFFSAAPHFPECMLRWDSSSSSHDLKMFVCFTSVITSQGKGTSIVARGCVERMWSSSTIIALQIGAMLMFGIFTKTSKLTVTIPPTNLSQISVPIESECKLVSKRAEKVKKSIKSNE